ncbi:MAG: GNAT family N-acetyltransferase [Syntrophales bacterium]|jgi:GNAT superfamily N-acetyltransferase|nr:GNAT family N-acetyltransferase [Syntrophales bacterium]MDY0045563.1 GNAT family N-acetyltransferase [Syntrophales bacterium]
MVIIREATLEDQDQVFERLRQLMSSAQEIQSAINEPGAVTTFRQIVSQGLGTVLVAEEDGSILGLVTLSYPVAIRCGGVYACIEEFIVSPSARGKGVGGKLLQAAIKTATEKGCFEIEVNRPSELGYPVYLRNGWQDLGKHLNFYPKRERSS